MRIRRIKTAGAGIYHCMSRTVNGAALFQNKEKEVMRKMIRQVADFSGVEILTYCVMNNHFHLLVRVLSPESVSDKELIRRYGVLYPKPTRYQTASIKLMARELENDGEDAAAIRARLLARMGDVSGFMKTLKQRFSTWFNKTHDRYGPLWSDRFKSVLVEGKGNVLQTIAAYIDLNPVRSGTVDDPKDYRFCGYAEAMAGHGEAVRGIKFMTAGLEGISMKDALQAYRCTLFGKGQAPAPGAGQINRTQAVRVLEKENGRLSTATLLRCRIRYFSEGVVLGSPEFVAAQKDAWRRLTGRKFPPKEPIIRCEESPPIAVMRGVRGSPFS